LVIFAIMFIPNIGYNLVLKLELVLQYYSELVLGDQDTTHTDYMMVLVLALNYLLVLVLVC